MNQYDLENHLKTLPLGVVHFLPKTASTNDVAASWIEADCSDLALVVADEQTAGRGRSGRKWFTPAGSALAFSLVLRPMGPVQSQLEQQNTGILNGLGALAVCQTMQKKYQLSAAIKWPNDVLVEGRKLAGILTEAHWVGSELAAVVIGIGINVATKSVPPVDWDTLNLHPFPATCMDSILGVPVNRWDLLYSVLEELLTWREQLSTPKFMDTWQENLAFLGEWVQIIPSGKNAALKEIRIIGLEEDGSLQILEKSGKLNSLRVGEILPSNPPRHGFNLRPVDS
jgi:BirA family biotin operon repressor/biotin-[acetyl-CoA-carboxylase] ligase